MPDNYDTASVMDRFDLARDRVNRYHAARQAIMLNQLQNAEQYARAMAAARSQKEVADIQAKSRVDAAEIAARHYADTIRAQEERQNAAIAAAEKRQQIAAAQASIERLLQNVPPLDTEDLTTQEGIRKYQARALQEYGRTILQPKIDEISNSAKQIEDRQKEILNQRQSVLLSGAYKEAFDTIAGANKRVAKEIEGGSPQAIDKAIAQMSSAKSSTKDREAARTARQLIADANTTAQAEALQLIKADETINSLAAKQSALQSQYQRMEIAGALPYVDFARSFRGTTQPQTEAGPSGEKMKGFWIKDLQNYIDKSKKEAPANMPEQPVAESVATKIAANKTLSPMEKSFAIGAAQQVQGGLGQGLATLGAAMYGPNTIGALGFLPQSMRESIGSRLIANAGNQLGAVQQGYEEAARLGDLSVPTYQDPTVWANIAGQAAANLVPLGLTRFLGLGAASRIPPRLAQPAASAAAQSVIPPVVGPVPQTQRLLTIPRGVTYRMPSQPTGPYNMPGPVSGYLRAPSPIDINNPPRVAGYLNAPTATTIDVNVPPIRPVPQPSFRVYPNGVVEPVAQQPVQYPSMTPNYVVPVPAPANAVGYVGSDYWRQLSEQAGIPGVSLY